MFWVLQDRALGMKWKQGIAREVLSDRSVIFNQLLLSSDTLGPLNSQRGQQTERGENMDTFRSTMSTARVQTALAALTAEKLALEQRLERIDAALEGEKKKSITKFRQRK